LLWSIEANYITIVNIVKYECKFKTHKTIKYIGEVIKINSYEC